jgi:hypothetical protein
MLDPLSSLNGGNRDTQKRQSEGSRHQLELPGALSKKYEKSEKDWIDIAVTACRPFQLLDHLLLRYNLPPPQVQSITAMQALESVPEFRKKYEELYVRDSLLLQLAMTDP